MIYVLSYRNEIYEGHGYWLEADVKLAHEKAKALGPNFRVIGIKPAVPRNIEIIYKSDNFWVVKCPFKVAKSELARRVYSDSLDLDSPIYGEPVDFSVTQIRDLFYVRVFESKNK